MRVAPPPAAPESRLAIFLGPVRRPKRGFRKSPELWLRFGFTLGVRRRIYAKPMIILWTSGLKTPEAL